MRILVGAAAVLAGLAFLSFRMAYPTVTADSVAGTYHRAPVQFLKVAHVPEQLVLRNDGTISLLSGDGAEVFAGLWKLDPVERVFRVNDVRWDRQIRVRSTLFGPRISMRVSDLTLEDDHPEHDEEVDFNKADS